MMRSLLLALVLALAVVAPVQAHESWHEATGSISALSATSISVKGIVVPPAAAPTPDVLTCAITSRSPSVADLELGDRIYALCDFADGRQTLMTVVRQNVVRKFTGPITALTSAKVTIRTAKGRVSCALTRATAAKLRGMKIGHKVTLTCRLAGSKMVLVSVQAAGGHAGHAGHGG